MKVVFDTRPGSGYSDTVERYQFPSRYLRDATAAVGDWTVHYEPSRQNGRRSYVAVAKVVAVEPDPTRAGHHLAVMREYLPFDRPVPLRGLAGYYERHLREIEDPTAIGRALQGRSVRPLAPDDFVAIIALGLSDTLSPENAARLDLAPGRIDPATAALLGEKPGPRVVEQLLSNRTVRDAAFRRAVLYAYSDTCAVTGLRIVNGGGRAEAQAAHILPVAEGGPDVVQNGIALSATAHWLFDRHLISIGEDWRLLVSHNKVPEAYQSLLARQEAQVRLPVDAAFWPDPGFVARHRERFAFG